MDEPKRNPEIYQLTSTMGANKSQGKIIAFSDMMIYSHKEGLDLDEYGAIDKGKVVITLQDFNQEDKSKNKRAQYFVDTDEFLALCYRVLHGQYTLSKQDKETLESEGSLLLMDKWGGGVNKNDKYHAEYVSRRLRITLITKGKDGSPAGPMIGIAIDVFPGKKTSIGAFIKDGEILESLSNIKPLKDMYTAFAAAQAYILKK